MTDAERIIHLEERFTHLQQHITEQDKIILGLDEQVRRLRAELTAQRERTDAPRLPRDELPADERPPHY